MNAADVLLVLGALVIAGFVGLLVVVVRATARTADNAREILVALEDIQARTSVLAQLDGMGNTDGGTRPPSPGSLGERAGNGSGEGTEVPS